MRQQKLTFFSLSVIFVVLFSVYLFSQQEEKPVLAVIDLEGKRIQKDEAEIITGFLEESIFNTNMFELVSRTQIEKVMQELQYQQSGICDFACAVEVGKHLAAKKVLIGVVGKLGRVYTIQVKLIDVESSRIEEMKSIRVECEIGQLPDYVGNLVNGLFSIQTTQVVPEKQIPKITPEKKSAQKIIEKKIPLTILKFEFFQKWGSFGRSDTQFNRPIAIAIDNKENVYVVDRKNHCVKRFNSKGVFSGKLGNFKSRKDGYFSLPCGIAIDILGYIYVVDTNNNRIQKFNSKGDFVRKWGHFGSGNGEFHTPYDIAIDNSGYVYVADSVNHRIQKFTLEGAFISKWGSYGKEDGEFGYPRGIAVDNSGFVYVYVTDKANHKVQKFTPEGAFVKKWGSQGNKDGQFDDIRGIATDSHGYIYVADAGNNRIQVFTPDGDFMGKLQAYGKGNERLKTPAGITVDNLGYIYIADTENHRILKFRIK